MPRIIRISATLMGSLVLVGSLAVSAQRPADAPATLPGGQPPDTVFLEDLTWAEARDLIGGGWTTVIVGTAGTEQKGPHMVDGEHKFVMAWAADRIARALGRTLVAPVITYVPEGSWETVGGHMSKPGTITLPEDRFVELLVNAGRSLKAGGFTTVLFLGESGGNRSGMRTAATRLNDLWQGTARAFWVDDYYTKSHADQNAYVTKTLGIPENEIGGHANILDTSEMLFVNPAHVRPAKLAPGGGYANSGVSGDPTKASAELGRVFLQIKIDNALVQIRGLMAGTLQPAALPERGGGAGRGGRGGRGRGQAGESPAGPRPPTVETAPPGVSPTNPPDTVFIDELTWEETRDLVKGGRTVAIVPTGGTEKNGYHMILGKHNYIVTHAANLMARRLGNALVAPTIQYVPEGNPDNRPPGVISHPSPAFDGLLDAAARSLKAHGFTDILIIGDSGGNQGGIRNVAAVLNEEWKETGARVFPLTDYYEGGREHYRAWMLAAFGYDDQTIGSHAGISDTSQLLFVRPEGVRADRIRPWGGASDSGVSGDPTKSTAEIGRMGIEFKVNAAIAQYRQLKNPGRGGRGGRGGASVAFPPPIDVQAWQDQDDMTWADYRPIPGASWGDPSRVPERAIRVALVAIDFEDQPFVITQPKGSDPFGNPQVDPVPREQVPAFYASFWGTPGALNHGHTIHEYWMEQSRGKVGIPRIDAYGPYRMPRRLFEYGLNEYGQRSGCPGGFTCDGRMERDADALWVADAGEDVRSGYDVVLRIYAGYDETTVWQEFGEMTFASREDIPERWGNPDRSMPRWVATRYVPWTSWLAGAQQWGLSSVRQGESSGTITHELGHLVFRVGDNNNNPYVTPYRRVGTGPWDMMDRGSFNGPGGPHRRWVVPAAEGASMPAGLMLRNRLAMELLPIERVLQLSRDALARSGPAVARVVARAVDPGAGVYAGVSVRLDGEAPHDRTPACDRDADPLCPGDPVFNFYSVEVVQRIGYDSFTPDSGVLIAKNKDRQSNSCGYGCHAWVVDARPEDIDRLDFVRPNGERVMRTIADYRQLNDALFHAGLRSGSAAEWVDEPNRLHFYVIERHVNADGVLSYTVGVRSLDGAGTQVRGVGAEAPATAASSRTAPSFSVTVRNTGTAPVTVAGGHAGATAAAFASDIFRVAVAVDGDGWLADVQNALVAVRAGESAAVPVFAWRASGSGGAARVTVSVVSESDSSRRAEAVTTVGVAAADRP